MSGASEDILRWNWFLHEGFWLDDVNKFTRPWFAWCNTLFGELVLDLARRKPHLLF
jgi:meiotically up-regulated gene 157 (Mug157) protein